MNSRKIRILVIEDEAATRLARIEEELDVCFRAGDDTLARPLIRRKLETGRYAEQLERRGAAVGKTLETLRDQVEENRERLRGMRQKMELLVAESHHGPEGPAWGAPDYSVRDEEVEVALLRERERRAQS